MGSTIRGIGLRADAGATVAYVRLDQGYTMASYFVDLDGLTLYVANDLDRAENLVWAFDDRPSASRTARSSPSRRQRHNLVPQRRSVP